VNCGLAAGCVVLISGTFAGFAVPAAVVRSGKYRPNVGAATGAALLPPTFAMDDPAYRAAYRAHVDDFLTTVFDPSRVGAVLRSEQARIAPYVIGQEGETAARTFAGTPAQFDAAVYGPNGLLAYVTSRAAAVRAALRATP